MKRAVAWWCRLKSRVVRGDVINMISVGIWLEFDFGLGIG